MTVCEQWPMLPQRNKYISILGTQIQKRVKESYVSGEATQIPDVEKCDRRLLSLERLLDNHYMKKYPSNNHTPVSVFVKQNPDDKISVTELVDDFLTRHSKQ